MMENDIYLRPMSIDDAMVSFRWRNDPELWRYTENCPDREITIEMEREWAVKAIENPARRNYAICLKGSNRHIGNIYLVNIHNTEGELGIFIGEKKYQGMGYGQRALALLKDLAKKEGLTRIRIGVNNQNVAALISYLKQGAVFHEKQWLQLEVPL